MWPSMILQAYRIHTFNPLYIYFLSGTATPRVRPLACKPRLPTGNVYIVQMDTVGPRCYFKHTLYYQYQYLYIYIYISLSIYL